MDTNVINIDPNILGGTPVFRGTRVPVESLFHHLKKGISIEEFLDDFPTVNLEQVKEVMAIVGQMLATSNFRKQYENIKHYYDFF